VSAIGSVGEKRRRQRAPSRLLEAVVSDPPTRGDFLRVEVIAQPGPVREAAWRQGDADPQPDDPCAVMESDEGNLWVVGYAGG
jgi:hypothetical protein